MQRKNLLFVFALGLAWLLPQAAGAQSGPWPQKPVRFIVPFPPGSGTDVMARVLANKLGEKWQQAVVAQGDGIGRRGVRIFTPDKEQLRENVARSGHRPLALELAGHDAPRHGVHQGDRLYLCMLRFGRRAADMFCRLRRAHRHHRQFMEKHANKNTHTLGI